MTDNAKTSTSGKSKSEVEASISAGPEPRLLLTRSAFGRKWEKHMLTSEERAIVTYIADRLIELYARRDEARAKHDWEEVRCLEGQITEAAVERKELIASTDDES